MIHFGMPTLVENTALQENISLCRRLGLRFIELNMNVPEYQLDALEQADRLLEAADAAGIYFTVQHGAGAAADGPGGQLFKDPALKRLVPLRDRYGDPMDPLVLNMHMHHGIHITLPDRKVQMYERNLDCYLESCRRFRDLCGEWIGDAPLRMAVENTDGFRSYEKEAVALFLESPCFGLTWDVGHSKAVGETDLPFLLEHEDRLIHFHIHDGTEQPPRDHLALGTGAIDLAARLRLAEKHRCRCVLETKTVRALEQSVAWLRENCPGLPA